MEQVITIPERHGFTFLIPDAFYVGIAARECAEGRTASFGRVEGDRNGVVRVGGAPVALIKPGSREAIVRGREDADNVIERFSLESVFDFMASIEGSLHFAPGEWSVRRAKGRPEICGES